MIFKYKYINFTLIHFMDLFCFFASKIILYYYLQNINLKLQYINMFSNFQTYLYLNSFYPQSCQPNQLYPCLYYSNPHFQFIQQNSSPNLQILFDNTTTNKQIQQNLLEIQQNTEVETNLKIKTSYKNQNPYRNILTNIANQLLGFLLSYRKSLPFLLKMIPNLSHEQQEEFYKYVKILKKSFGSYFNLKKFKALWFGENIKDPNYQFHRIIRVLSKYFLETKLVISFLTSQKVSKQLKNPLLKAKRILSDILCQKIDIEELPKLDQINQYI